jgi:hypothetical protein
MIRTVQTGRKSCLIGFTTLNNVAHSKYSGKREFKILIEFAGWSEIMLA